LARGKKDNAKPRLLLVVSDDLIRDIFRKLFERSGYYTVAVEKAKDGLETLNNECFDVIIWVGQENLPEQNQHFDDNTR
jgi:DNA-binding NtrC family response regulator